MRTTMECINGVYRVCLSDHYYRELRPNSNGDDEKLFSTINEYEACMFRAELEARLVLLAEEKRGY